MCWREATWQIINAYGHKTYQGSDILQGAPIHKFASPLNEVIMRGHVTNRIHFTSISKRPMDIELGKVLTYSERLPSLKPHDSNHMTNIKARGNLKIFYFHYHKTYGQ